MNFKSILQLSIKIRLIIFIILFVFIDFTIVQEQEIDEVEILDINSVEATDDGGLEIDGIWKVSGSVNHYGHTHYRQNINQASINIIADEGAWKILQMNMIDEKRVL